jgi:V8-like Glu-specific endopeptidase
MIARHQGAALALVTLLGFAACAPDSPTGPAAPDVEPSLDRTAASRPNQVRPDNAQVRAYWTAERMARATPRDYVIDANGQVQRGSAAQRLRGRPPRDGSSEVTGASWTGDGEVLEATGRAYFTLDGTDYTCSGAIVQDSDASRIVVLTAGHCVYDEVSDQFATYFAFIANYDARTAFFTAEGGCAAYPTECWVARSLVATEDWAAGDSQDVNWEADFGFAVFEETAGLDPSPGYQLVISGAAPDPVSAFGYPAEKGYDGTDLVYCSGATIADPYSPNTNWGLKCDMQGGSSGGPWLDGTVTTTSGPIGTIVSVVSYGYIGGRYKAYLFGPLFSNLTQSALAAALQLPASDAEELVQ